MAAALAASDKLWNCVECRQAKLDGPRHCPLTGSGHAPFPVYEIDGVKYFTCPVGHITSESYEALSMYAVYKDGFLPASGGFMDQDHRIMQQIKIIAAAVHEVEEKRWRKPK